MFLKLESELLAMLGFLLLLLLPVQCTLRHEYNTLMCGAEGGLVRNKKAELGENVKRKNKMMVREMRDKSSW